METETQTEIRAQNNCKKIQRVLQAAGLTDLYCMQGIEDYPNAVAIFGSQDDMDKSKDGNDYALYQIIDLASNEGNGWVFQFEVSDAGVMYHRDGSGTPPSYDWKESEEVYSDFYEAAIALALFIIDADIREALFSDNI